MKAKKLLEYKLKGERNLSSRRPLIIDERLYIIFLFDRNGASAGKIVCLDKNNFEVLWDYDHPFTIANLLKSPGDTVLASCMDGKLLELNPHNGDLMNSFELQMDRNGQSSNIVDNKLVFGGVQRTRISTCFDLGSSCIKWVFDNNGHTYTPLIANGKVYQCAERYVRCLDLNSGSLIWEAFEETTYMFNPTVIKNMLVVGGHGLVNFYNDQNGKLLHQIETGVRESIRAIIHEENTIFFGDSAGYFYAYKISQHANASGEMEANAEILWKYTSNGGIESTPIIKGNHVLFINDDNKLISLDKASGELKWEFNTKGKAGISGIITADDMIYTAVEKGYVYKLIEE